MGGIWLLHGFQVLTCRLSFCTLMAGLLFSATEVSKEGFHVNNPISKDDATPIVVVIPGLASDSSSASDCFYNAGWTGDVRSVIDYLHREYPQAPLFVVGTSIGANILASWFFHSLLC
ncbi:hypothetical protein NE237_022105 [Protea cynaroides]|uniref:Uncharacterized protein n=1 Tax=Protea cynaroides TaxID=273540 RepID=A0A9Q0H8Z6_9MAGN|nr:hypothetical protein NE237_022105 [Protea cynaroides]